MNKKLVLIVDQIKSNSLVKQKITGNDSDVRNALKHLFGKDHITKNIESNIGLSYGLKKATAFGS